MEEEARRRLAARIGRDVKKFWGKIDKIISFKVKLQADELRKAAMDRHLKQLVAQTEKYAAALASTFQEGREAESGHNGDAAGDDERSRAEQQQQRRIQDASEHEEEEEATAASGLPDASDDRLTTPELQHSATPRDRASGADDSDYAMPSDEELDDETTIAVDEQLTTTREVEEEVALLAEEGELPIEELRRRYAAALAGGGSDEGASESEQDGDVAASAQSAGDDDGDGDEDFEPPTDEEGDDERTIAAAEANDFTRYEVAEEMQLLQEESELSLEELRARYGGAFDASDDASDEEEKPASRSALAESSDADEDSKDVDTDEDFEVGEEEPDDESTIAEAERTQRRSRQDLDDELTLLQEEGELSVEELLARYAHARDDDGSDGDDAGGVEDGVAGDNQIATSAAATADDTSVASDAVAGDERLHTSTLHRSVPGSGFKRPYLLTSRLSLREYQEAGVNWLVSMCEKRINGILADEMGLGKTIQTITMLAHLACSRGIWGPHLIVVPTSCLVNWEMEFKRWCPAFKVLTYFGSAKRRKELRQGWSKQNVFQICITSYQLVVQDAHCFKRKKWYYLILDEAHNIKNWKSLRWQTLLTFNSQRRLLLTGTPLQNNIMELWSLMHFLMPHVFSSRREFTYWFQNPLASMVEGEQDVNSQLVSQLHGIIRPFVLRRLKKDVAKQMPGKFEHVVTCKLSKRQRYLYEDFISRSSTRRAMFGSGRGKGGANFMSMMNVLMQLRKVCNHPDLFEPRPIASPLDLPSIRFYVPSRCGFLTSALANEGRDLPYWSQNRNLPNLELAGCEKHTSSRWRQLYFYDVNVPLPPETRVSEAAKERYQDKKDILRRLVQLAEARARYWQEKRARVAEYSRLRVELTEEPMYGSDLIRACTLPVFVSHAMDVHVKRGSSRAQDWLELSDAMSAMVVNPEDRVAALTPIITRAVCFVPRARAQPVELIYSGGSFAPPSVVARHEFVLSRKHRIEEMEREQLQPLARRCLDVYYEAFKRTQLFFPDKRLVQFDCGKLQQLDALLRELKRGGHRCLIFTQMSSMLNILEIFLNIHGYELREVVCVVVWVLCVLTLSVCMGRHTYFRLDGSTKVEKRQSLMDRFNRDEKIFCFILSTRSGGLGINLTGADSVIFYDSDWNPAMDAQAQDRAHRIGQTRDVHIYRLVSEHTVEENILKKAQQKRHLDFLVMAEGQFTTDFFSKASLRELMTGDDAIPGSSDEKERDDESADEDGDADDEMSYEALENAMAQVEDEEDVVAMKGAKEEFMSEQREFEEESTSTAAPITKRLSSASSTMSAAAAARPSTPSSVNSSVSGKDDEDEEMESVDGSVATDEATESQTGGDEEHADERGEEENSVEAESDDDAVESSEDSDGSLAAEDEAIRSRKRRRSSTSAVSTRQKRRRKDGVAAAKSQQQQQRAQEKAREKQIEMEEERKLQEWKNSVSSLKGFEDSLNPVDRYALHFREEIDPLYAYVPTAAAIESYFDSQLGSIDIDKIEEEKMREEATLIAEGELIAGAMLEDGDDAAAQDIEEVHRELYRKERAHMHFERRRRQLTGAGWQLKKCVVTNHPFYFNVDTREAVWDRPAILTTNEDFARMQLLGFAGLLPSVLLVVMQYLSPHPDRHQAELVCRSWHQAAIHPSLFVKLNANDLLARGQSIAQALDDMAFGGTVLFGSGVYQLDSVLEVKTPLKLLAAPDARVELQMTTSHAQLRWTARGGMICGFHVTRHSQADAMEGGRARSNWQHLLHVTAGGQVRVVFCDFDGNGQGNACVAVSGSMSSRAILLNNRIYNGGSSGVLLVKGDLVMVLNTVHANAHSGISVLAGNALLRRNKIQKNGRFGIRLLYHAGSVIIEENIVNDHPCGNIDVENSGRRFVVRWNEMAKDEPDDLPHTHGKLLLKTFQIVEKEIVRASSSLEKSVFPILPPAAAGSRVELQNGVARAESAGAVPPNPFMVRAAPTTVSNSVPPLSNSATASVSAHLDPAMKKEPATTAITMQQRAEIAGAHLSSSHIKSKEEPAGESSVMQVALVSAVDNSRMALATASGGASTSGASGSAKPVGVLEANATSSVSTVGSNVLKTEGAPVQPKNGEITSTATTTTPTAAAGAPPVATKIEVVHPAAGEQRIKLKRKRRPKMERLLVAGRVIVFQDSCEKRTDKVKKLKQSDPVAAAVGVLASVGDAENGQVGFGAAAADAVGANAVPVVVKKRRGRKPKVKLAAEDVIGTSIPTTATTPASAAGSSSSAPAAPAPTPAVSSASGAPAGSMGGSSSSATTAAVSTT